MPSSRSSRKSLKMASFAAETERQLHDEVAPARRGGGEKSKEAQLAGMVRSPTGLSPEHVAERLKVSVRTARSLLSEFERRGVVTYNAKKDRYYATGKPAVSGRGPRGKSAPRFSDQLGRPVSGEEGAIIGALLTAGASVRENDLQRVAGKAGFAAAFRDLREDGIIRVRAGRVTLTPSAHAKLTRR